MVVRSVNVGSVHRGGQAKTEMICFAIARGTVMRYVDLLKKCSLEAAGAHTEITSMVRAFDHLTRRELGVVNVGGPGEGSEDKG